MCPSMHECPEGEAWPVENSSSRFLGLPRATLLRGYFEQRAEVLREIAADGWWPMAWRDAPGAAYPPHLHVGAEALYMLEGDLEFEDLEADAVLHLEPGDKLVLPARVVHRVATTGGATYILGLSVLVPFTDHFIPAD